MTKPPAISSKIWKDYVSGLILDGYGVEDIALRLDCHVSHVREYVSELRRNGMLKKWFSRD